VLRFLNELLRMVITYGAIAILTPTLAWDRRLMGVCLLCWAMNLVPVHHDMEKADAAPSPTKGETR